MSEIIPFQRSLDPALPTVCGNVDYRRFEAELSRMDEILRLSGSEQLFVGLSLEAWEGRLEGTLPSTKQRLAHQQQSYRALRCTLLQRILGEGYRGMSRRLAECPLFQWFCGLDRLEVVKVPGKSQLQRYADWLPAEQMDRVVGGLLQAAASPDEQGANPLKLAQQIELDTVWLDGTCVEANIHFPVDWVLLRDGTRTLMKATGLIRRHGLKHRMQEPEHFISQMNKLCMGMTHSGKQAESKKARKGVLRRMKQLSKLIETHAQWHRALLDEHWEQTDWTRKQAEQVIERIDQVLLELPQARKQAHERIIGERMVKNEDKILSLYDSDVHVIVRGKAGAKVEFGNTLLIGEQAQGLVVDWLLYRESAPADSGQLPGSLERMEARFGQGVIEALAGDRGFDSESNRELLDQKGIFNGLCPRQPWQLKRRRHSGRFQWLQRRRSQIEGRIGILKNDFLGRPLRSKGFASRELSVVWSVLAHNLWVLARLERVEEAGSSQARAA